MGKAEGAGIQFGDYVTSVDVEQIGRPRKEWVYAPAFAILCLITLMQLFRKMKR